MMPFEGFQGREAIPLALFLWSVMAKRKRKPKKTAAQQIEQGLREALEAMRTGKKMRTTTVRCITNKKDGTKIYTRIKNYED